MEFSEKQQLIHSHPKPPGWYVGSSFIFVFSFPVAKPAVLSFRMGSPLETSERSQSASDEDELQRWERLCQQTDSPSGPDSDARHRARRKLCMACAVSLLFMAGEMIGRHKKNPKKL